MTPYPSVRQLLRRYGTTAAGRRAARQRLADHVVDTARREASTAGRSAKCRSANHRGATTGCENDGSSCLCFCHDPASGQEPDQEREAYARMRESIESEVRLRALDVPIRLDAETWGLIVDALHATVDALWPPAGGYLGPAADERRNRARRAMLDIYDRPQPVEPAGNGGPR